MNTSTTILACTDGSSYAASVYDHALWAAAQLSATVHVLYMIPPFNDATGLKNFSGSIGLDSRQVLKTELVKFEEAQGRIAQAKAHAILEDARAHLQAAAFKDYTADARHGHLAEYVERYESGAELVIIGKRGESADFERLHLGANVEQLIRSCHQPVLVAARTFRPVQRALIAYDGGRSACKAVEYLVQSPLLHGVELHLLAVGQPYSQIATDLAETGERLLGVGYQVKCVHENGNPEDVFASYISENEVDLLVMGAYGHSRIRQLIVGSTTTTMVRTSRVPVLMFR